MCEQDIVKKIKAVRDIFRCTGVMQLYLEDIKPDKTASTSFMYFTVVLKSYDDAVTKKHDEILIIMRSLFPDAFVDIFVVSEDQLQDYRISFHSENLLL